jgi:hypothetical protein
LARVTRLDLDESDLLFLGIRCNDIHIGCVVCALLGFVMAFY